MAEKTEVRIITVKGQNYIDQGDVVRLILQCALALSCADDRQIVKQLAENVASGQVHRQEE